MDQPSMPFGLIILLISSAVVLLVWIGLLVFRSFLESREDDQIFLDKAEESLAREQRELVARINKINPLIRTALILWIVLAVASAGVWIYEGLKSF
jgi:anaerobic C4-dicarboxylate transporter